jgi:hypothetical protein
VTTSPSPAFLGYLGRWRKNFRLLAAALKAACWCRAAILLAVLTPWCATAVGTWSAVTNLAPEGIATMLLLSDGTVMAAAAGTQNRWYRLTPDSKGNYGNGTWSTLAPMSFTRLAYSSAVLTNGTVLVAGGEYGTGGPTSELYDPIANTWTTTPPPPVGVHNFSDSLSKILPNGNVLVAPVQSEDSVIYVTASNLWTDGPLFSQNSSLNESSWVKLPDDSILTIYITTSTSERYIPSLNQWIRDADVPVYLWDNSFEIGPAFLLPDGRAFFLGGNGNTAFYTPSGSTNAGTWQVGPIIPNSQGAGDAPSAMMVNGHLLCAVSPQSSGASESPASFYEYDPVANAFTQVNAPTGETILRTSTYDLIMLDLPDGTVLLSTSTAQLWVYRPSGLPLSSGKPAISNLAQNADGSFHITGTGFNGISEGAAFGDDAQMDSNYPLVRLTNTNDGNVYYARTYNWNSTSVMTGNRLIGTDFAVPTGLATADYSLVVVANGFSSDPVPFLSATSLPLITLQPKSQTVPAGTNVTFTIAAAGSSLSYFWRRNGSFIPGATNTTYTTNNVQVPDSVAVFSCVVSNFNGATLSSNAVLTVKPDLPVITTQPANITVTAGGSASFSVVATSVAPRAYFWRRNGAFIPGATDPSYTTNNVSVAESGAVFSCLVSNATGTTLSSNAVLTVVLKPPNDFCSGALVITTSPYANSQSLAYATSQGDSAPPCTMFGFGNGVWYEFTPPSNGGMVVDTFGSSFKTAFATYFGSCGALTPIGCNDSVTGAAAAVSNSVTAGQTYYILAGGYTNVASSYPTGTLVLHLTFVPPPGPPLLTAQPIISNRFTFSFPTVNGQTYIVESKTQLTDENWTPLQTNAGNGGTETVTNLTATTPQRFFRLRLQ